MAAIYQATQYMRAGALMDGGAGVLDFGAFRVPLGQIGGLFAGMVVNLSLAYTATRLPSISGKHREQYAKAGFIGLLVMSPLLIGPVNYVLLDERVLAGWWPLRMALAILWASAMDVSIALVGIVDRSLMSLGKEKSGQVGDLPLRAAVKRRSKAVEATLAAKPATIWHCECGFETLNRNQYSGHAGKCPIHKQAHQGGKLIAVDLTSKEAM
jgi:hypothetical protein